MGTVPCEFEDNPFCALIPPEMRASVCAKCRTFRFAKRQDEAKRCGEISAMLDQRLLYCSVLIKGASCVNATIDRDASKSMAIWMAGDIINPQVLFDSSIEDELSCLYHYHYLTDGAYAIFPARFLAERFFSSPAFAAALCQNLTRTRIRQNHFLLGTQLQDAYSSILYLLLFCREHSITKLTHQDLAYLSGLNRVTVTKAIKQICEREALNMSLNDYTKSLYNWQGRWKSRAIGADGPWGVHIRLRSMLGIQCVHSPAYRLCPKQKAGAVL